MAQRRLIRGEVLAAGVVGAWRELERQALRHPLLPHPKDQACRGRDPDVRLRVDGRVALLARALRARETGEGAGGTEFPALQVYAGHELMRASKRIERDARARRECPLVDVGVALEIPKRTAERKTRVLGAVAEIGRELVPAERL